EAAGIGILTV
nr:Chain C, Melan-A/MART-1(26-35) peptide [synthetic construct]2GT9_F Chain F, Melan-A/MART-1(26-35) peptide [synthetic construct]4QOK_C Chain C, Melanoma antigen recognized by T-cells 1 marker peptide [Homo sapiens]6TMO_C Chain C, EAAGIGILTV [Homo sapiens]7Q9B_CCC Chain CCC, GLU-ALA-ALA-GLY-ILE-GLY-ILE-LEU-THR-VAL [Homo sapiens]7Q9B_HHH Chain HHH, GLU-ALA-ALA-GLY-ILE-GLY-ILE-LEU-THR-VAL [Homo sapiens]